MTCGVAPDRDLLGFGPWQQESRKACEGGAGVLSSKCLVTLDQLRMGLVLHMAGGLSPHVAHTSGSRGPAEQRVVITVTAVDPSLRSGHHQPSSSGPPSRSARHAAAMGGSALQSGFPGPGWGALSVATVATPTGPRS